MFVTTKNKMGYATDSPDPYSKEFIKHSQEKNLPALEIGAAYGMVTTQILKKNSKVYINDLSHKHLDEFWKSLDMDQKSRVTMCQGYFPDECSFEKDFFRSILACRVLHLLPPEKLKHALDYIYEILMPCGKFFFITDTPYLGILKDFIPVYKERLAEGDEFPGYIEDTSRFIGGRESDIPMHVNFLGLETVEKLFSQTKFNVKKVGYINQLSFPQDVRLDGRESLGLVAYKDPY